MSQSFDKPCIDDSILVGIPRQTQPGFKLSRMIVRANYVTATR
jgi:hypothetical protein